MKTFTVNNIPGQATVSFAPNNTIWFNVNAHGSMPNTYVSIPIYCAWGSSNISDTTTVYITDNAAPYVQVLTIVLRGIQTYTTVS